MRVAVLCTLLVAGGVASAETPPPVIELVTMGPSEDMFARYGHGTLCVIDAESPSGICYNYGSGDFSDPVRLTWDWLRGRTKFWVSKSTLARTLRVYGAEGRSVYRQRLDLAPESARGLAKALEDDWRIPERKYYYYHHFHDNCTTRLRDHIDRVTGGILRHGTDVPVGPTYRELARTGFIGSPPLLVAAEVVMGRVAEDRPTVWQAMFLPDVLRQVVARRLGAQPELAVAQTLPASTFQGSEAAGRNLLVAVGGGLALILLLGALPRRAWLWRFVLLPVGLALGAIGAAFWTVAAVTSYPEMRSNELVLVFWGTDLLIPFLWGRALLGYAIVRLWVLALVVAGVLAGLLIQPLWAPMAVSAFPLAVILLRELALRPHSQAASWAADERSASSPRAIESSTTS